ncbi:uncharacterized protein LOC6643247 [Drosophila willistoni]|uniref:uncharacterized protein LOC6643247 n=1 Tax=Drosophila willistoni TaxID=7260 RepID=UPI000C26CFCA|nr:uncharacterized protein LOC6643247 [Drosophila willistoni]
MCIKAILLLAVILAAHSGCFGGGSGGLGGVGGDGSSRRTLAVACEQTATGETAAAAVGMGMTYKNNRYTNKNNNYKDYNDYNYEYADADAIADSNNNGNNNDNYNYNKALAKRQEEQQLQPQILYGNPSQNNIYDYSTNSRLQQREQQQQQQKQLEQQQQQRQFDDDPENARNDFRLQLSDLNAAIQGVVLGMGRGRSKFAGQEQNQDNANDNNVQQELELSMERRSQREPGQPEYYVDDDDDTVAAPADARTGDGVDVADDVRADDSPSDNIDFEGEEEYAVQRFGQKEDADELSSQLPYGIQNVRKRRVRSVMPPTQQFNSNPSTNPNSNDGVTYQSLCPTNRVTVKLDMGEYRPNHYVEVTCAHNYAPQPSRMHNYDYSYRSNELPLLRALLSERGGEKREICSATGFSCIQLNRTIHLIRLNEDSGCWESETRTVPSGCECMWPKHSYGDIAFYHQAQKRGGPLLRRTGAGASAGLGGGSSAGIDYKPGVGYRQLKLRSRNRRDNFGPFDESYDLN